MDLRKELDQRKDLQHLLFRRGWLLMNQPLEKILFRDSLYMTIGQLRN